MIMLTESTILKHVSKTDSTPIQEIAGRLGLPQIIPKLVDLIFKMCREGVLEFIETDKSVVRSTKLLKIPEDAYPNCRCRSEIHTYVREYTTGTEFWIYCCSCEASGYEGIPVYKIGQLSIPQSIMSDLLSKLEMVENLQDRRDLKWHRALYTGIREFERAPRSDTAREKREIYNRVREIYTQLQKDRAPRHKLASLTAEAVDMLPRTVRR